MTVRFEPLTSLVAELAEALAPLADRLNGVAQIQDLLAEHGVVIDVVPVSIEEVGDALAALADAASALAGAAAASDAGALVTAALAAGEAVRNTSAALTGLPAGLERDLPALAAQLAAVDIASIGERLFDQAVADRLHLRLPALLAALAALGLVEGDGAPRQPVEGGWPQDGADLTATADPAEAATLAPRSLRIHFDRFERLIDDARGLFEEVYGWGAAPFAGDRLLARVFDLLRAIGVTARWDSAAAAALPAGVEPIGQVLVAPLFAGVSGGAAGELALTAAAVAGAASDDDGGLVLSLQATGAASVDLPIGDAVTLTVEAAAALASGLALVIRPPFAVEAIADPAGAASAAAADVALSFRWAPPGGFTPLAAAGLTTLTVEAVELGAGLVSDGAAVSPSVAIGLRGGRLAIGSGEADSLLREAIGGGSEATFELGASWSPATGVRFDGTAGLSVQIFLNAAIGPVRLDWITLEALVSSAGAELALRATGGFALGPFTATLDGIGVGLALTPAAMDGNLGPFQLAPPFFLPPHGLGLAIDIAEIIHGGGYLYIDADAGKYAGIAQVELLGIGITAIGVIATRMPDGSDGWSMFLSLSATFTGLQLGFGFTLNGVGGLVGINRGVDLDALSDGVRAGALDGLLFPDDPIGDAARILADIDAIFPPVQGQYVFGPMAQIGWGTPSLATVDLGIIIQLPDPITISLIGSFECVLPSADVAVVELRIDVAGSLDLTNRTLAIDASLRDSKVLGLTLSGDMAMRADFGAQPSFLMAFGGFNPRFVPPASFPTLDRLAVALDGGEVLQIEVSGYFAVTSNTLQFGAACSLWAKAVGLTVEGNFQLNALLQWKPFWFVVDLGFDVSVRAGSVELFGVHLALTFDGPNPWHALGTATVKILGIKKDFRVEASIGRSIDDGPRDRVDVRALVLAELASPGAWSEAPLAADVAVVTLAASTSATEVRVHPAGQIDVRQRLVPLDVTLDHYGGADLSGLDRFSLSTATLDGTTTGSTAVDDWFAPAQYFALSNEEKLSAPSFETFACGVRLGDAGVAEVDGFELPLGYEQIVRDPEVDDGERKLDAVHVPRRAALEAQIATSRVAVARGRAGLSRPSSRFALAPTTYVVADTRSAVIDRATPAAGVSYSAARTAVHDGAAEHVVPAYEPALEEDAA